MDMSFSPQDEAFRREVHDFVRNNLPADIRRKAADGAELSKADLSRWMGILGKRGWLATNWDTKDGGPGWSATQKHIFEEVCAAEGAPEIVPFGTRMVGPVLLQFGTEEQKQRFIPGILTAETLWCQG